MPIVSNERCQPEVLDLQRGRATVEKSREMSAQFGTTLTEANDEVVIGIPVG